MPDNSPSDDVRAAIAQLQNPDVAKEPPEPDTETDLTAEPETPQQKADRERDEKGRFVAKAPEKAAAEPEAKDLPTRDTKESKPAEPQASAAKPPPSWLAEAKVEWSKLSPAVQQAVLKRETEISDGFAQKSAELKRFAELEGIIAPRREYFKRFGHQSDAQAINHLLTLSDSMERDAAGTIAFLAKHYGVSLAPTGAQPQFQQSQTQQPAAPQQDVATLVREQIGFVNAQSEIEQFAADESHPHFHAVRPLMSHLLQSGAAKTLEDAYEQAVWANPALRNERLESLKAQKAQEDQAAAKAALDAKKRASNASLSGAPHGAAPATRKANSKPATNAHDDALDDVRAAIAQLS